MSIKIANQELVQVTFYDDTLECVKQDGTVYTSVSRVCQALGMDVATQRGKLRAAHWARCVIIPCLDRNQHSQDCMMIDVESMPLWLASISPNRVSDYTRAKLILFQNEAKKVLAEHFLGKATTEPAYYEDETIDRDDDDHLTLVLRGHLRHRIELARLKRMQDQQLETIKAVDQKAIEATQKAEEAIIKATATAQAVYNQTGYLCALGYARTHKLNVPGGQLAQIGKMAGKICAEQGIVPVKINDARYGSVNSYPENILRSLHHEFVMRSSNPRNN